MGPICHSLYPFLFSFTRSLPQTLPCTDQPRRSEGLLGREEHAVGGGSGRCPPVGRSWLREVPANREEAVGGGCVAWEGFSEYVMCQGSCWGGAAVGVSPGKEPPM